MNIKKLIKNPVVGYAKDIKIIDGKLIFTLMDSIGFPFDTIIELLKENNLGFDVKSFIECAYESKNYSKNKIELLFEYNKPKINSENLMIVINNLIKHIYQE